MDSNTLYWVQQGITGTIQDRFSMSSLSVTYLSSAMLFNMNFDLSLFVAIIGALGGATSIAKNGIDAYRSYLSIKKDKVQADKIMKELDKEELEDSDKNNGSNI